MTRVATLLAVLAVALVACGPPPEPAGIVRDPAPVVGDASLPDVAAGEAFAFVAPEDEVLVVYFGFTSCPDVCPTTMSDLKRALAQLPEDRRELVEVLMVTVDPDRDDAEKLTAYVTTFVPDGAASRFEDPAGLEAAADAFGVQYSVETNEEGEVEVGHSADLYAVDDRGDVVLQWPFGVTEDDLASDISTLLDRTSSA